MARELCHRKGIFDRRGRPREVAVRIELARLARGGAVSLPPCRVAIPPPAVREAVQPPDSLYGGTAADCRDVMPVEVRPVTRRDRQDHADWVRLMGSSHYLGAGPLCGAQIRYLVRCSEGLLGALAFSASAWRLGARDRWIGWSESARARNLQSVVANSRFLLPLEIPNLASHVLSQCLARLPTDWYDQYGYKPLLVESFVDPERFEGTCYRAAGWTHVGATVGRGRQDRQHRAERGPKDIYVFALDSAAREKLCIEPVQPPNETGDWAATEFGAAALPDERLKKRLCVIARDFFARPTANVPQACGNRAKTKAMYRFCGHERVTMEAILKPHFEASLGRAAKEQVVLAVQDTTSLNYTMHPATRDLGPIGSFGAQATLGLLVHSTLLVNPAGTPLGLLDVQCWARDSESTLKAKDRESLPICGKESDKWMQSYAATVQAQRRLSTTKFVNVADREADIFELFLEARRSEEAPGLLVRAVQSRKLETDEPDAAFLWKHVRGLECMGTLPLSVPRSGSRPRRETTLEVRFAEVKLRPPRRLAGKRAVTMWAIVVCEASPPPQGTAIEWLLLTSLPVTTLEEAAEKVAWYTLRWQIEVYHRTLKSGCRIENRQLASAHSLRACIAVDLVVGWRIFHLAKLGRELPDVPCTIFFEDAEWRALVCFLTRTPTPPTTPPTLRAALRMVAGLGGFLGRKSDGNPGTQTLWLGLQRLDDIAATFQIFAAPVPAAPDTS